jgi:hypothetical protein
MSCADISDNVAAWSEKMYNDGTLVDFRWLLERDIS